MKIAIVGTSNSVLTNGYAPLYRAIEYPHQVDNFSLGATICQFIPFALEKHAICENYDFLLTDSCPNDSDCFYCGQRTTDWFYNELCTIFSTIKETQIKHLHLIFPYKSTKLLQKMHVQVCEELSIPYLDIGTILSPIAEKEKQDFFQDIHHVSPYFAKQLAYCIKQKREEIMAQPQKKSGTSYKTKVYSTYDLTKHFQGQYPLVTRASSHLCEQFIRLKTKEKLHLTNLPALNLEGLYFYTNKEAGFFNLASEHASHNYSLYFPTADYIFYQPIPQNTFAVGNFLILQAGYNKNADALIMENNAAPLKKDQSELMLNALFFSQKIDSPRLWEEKTQPSASQNDIQLFENIHTCISSLTRKQKTSVLFPADGILIGASLYPQNTWIRKEFACLLKQIANPYYFYYFALLYLFPRKKYTMAIRFLEKAVEIKNDIPFLELLITCYLEKKAYAKALKCISQKMPANHIITYKLFCMLAAAMQNKELFFLNAQKILSCNSHIDYLLFLASSCIKLKAFQEAVSLLNTALGEQRNFRPDNAEQNMQKINALMQKIQEQNE